jgi:hypothetical protein
MDTTESSAAHPHRSTEDHDDTVDAHYSGLERLRPHACIDGCAFVNFSSTGQGAVLAKERTEATGRR